jgi:regulator of RNase E activity RraA
VLFGRAATIRYVPYREDRFDEEAASFARSFYEAVTSDFRETVLVLDSSGQHDTSIGGSVKFSRLHNHGLAGLITDARIRDFDELARYSPAFYCSGEAAHAGSHTLMPVAVNVPVSLRGTTIVPGDYVYADRAAAVVIPAPHIDRVLELAREIDAHDRSFLQAIRAEDPRAIRKQGSNER